MSHPVTINKEQPLALHGTGPKICLTFQLEFFYKSHSVCGCVHCRESFLFSFLQNTNKIISKSYCMYLETMEPSSYFKFPLKTAENPKDNLFFFVMTYFVYELGRRI